MDKITRLLLLYSKLMQGEKVNKLSFCIETDSLPRTFDRDIEDIRLYLSDLFCNEELIYDRKENAYYFIGSQKKTLEIMEYQLIERVLLDTGVLRIDEMDGLLTHLVENTEDIGKMIVHKKECMDQYNGPLHKKAILKMHGDLVAMITNKLVIRINYAEMNGERGEREVIPCAIKYAGGYLYLIAFLRRSNKQYPVYFQLNRIHSFSIVQNQTMDDIQRVAKYIESYSKEVAQMYDEEFIEVTVRCKKEFYPYIHDKFRDAIIVSDQDRTMVVKLNTYEDNFIKWIMSQRVDLIQVIEPIGIKEKIINEANRLLVTYKEVQKHGKESQISIGNGARCTSTKHGGTSRKIFLE